MAAFDHPECDLVMHFDERGTAFMALGYGKATGKAAGWITTSGTALANGYPAVVEADLESTPILLLTADRPPELRNTDANQTIRQEHIFGSSVRWFFDMPPPSDEIDPTFVLTTVDQAVFRSSTGPVHLNCMFREPLAPSEEAYSPISSKRFDQWTSSTEPYTVYSSDGASFLPLQAELEASLLVAKRPLIIMGRIQGDGHVLNSAAQQLCQRFGAVFFSDISSQTRLGLGSEEVSHGLAHLDVLLTAEDVRSLHPDCIIQFGATPLSKQLQSWLNAIQATTYVVIDHRSRRIDSSHIVTRRVEADPVSLLTDWSDGLTRAPGTGPTGKEHLDQTEWQEIWYGLQKAASSWLSESVTGGKLTEQATATLLSRQLTPECALTVGSSNPVRHMDSFAARDGSYVPVLTNRGASGIDGTLASAVGFALGHSRRPVVFLGDLALLHDLNSMALCKARGAIVLVINNDGGGIFSYLPVRSFEAQFEPLFGTPHGIGFEAAATMFNMHYARPESLKELEEILSGAFSSESSMLIEVCTDRDANVEEARRLNKALRDRIGSLNSR